MWACAQVIASLQRDRLNYEMVIVKQRKQMHELSASVSELSGQSHNVSARLGSPPTVLRTPVRSALRRTPRGADAVNSSADDEPSLMFEDLAVAPDAAE